jgi:hypothetical protein
VAVKRGRPKKGEAKNEGRRFSFTVDPEIHTQLIQKSHAANIPTAELLRLLVSEFTMGGKTSKKILSAAAKKKTGSMKFISLWAPASLRRKLDVRAKKLGVSRSQAGLTLIKEGLSCPPLPSPINIPEVLRAKIEALKNQVEELKKELRDETKCALELRAQLCEMHEQNGPLARELERESLIYELERLLGSRAESAKKKDRELLELRAQLCEMHEQNGPLARELERESLIYELERLLD